MTKGLMGLIHIMAGNGRENDQWEAAKKCVFYHYFLYGMEVSSYSVSADAYRLTVNDLETEEAF